jgi:hypothetical protein
MCNSRPQKHLQKCQKKQQQKRSRKLSTHFFGLLKWCRILRCIDMAPEEIHLARATKVEVQTSQLCSKGRRGLGRQRTTTNMVRLNFPPMALKMFTLLLAET